MSIDLDEIEQARARIAHLATAMLDGETSYIEGSRLICGYLTKARLDRFELPFVAFVAIESETDTVPIGEVRDRWADAALSKFEQEWREAERYAKIVAEPAVGMQSTGSPYTPSGSPDGAEKEKEPALPRAPQSRSESPA